MFDISFSCFSDYLASIPSDSGFLYVPPIPSRTNQSYFSTDSSPISYCRVSVDLCQPAFNYFKDGSIALQASFSSNDRLTASNFTLDPVKQMMRRLRNSVSYAARIHCCEIIGLTPILDTSSLSDDDKVSYKAQCKRFKKTHKAMFVTLTYASGVIWTNKDMSNCIAAVRMWHKRRGIPFRYVWVAEIQEKRLRNSPNEHGVHYHLIVWLPKSTILPHFDSQGWWSKGCTNLKVSYAPIGYLLKYASKGCSGSFSFPRGCRKHGAGGMSKDNRMLKSWTSRPKYVKDHFPDFRLCIVPAKGGGWVSRVTGEHLPSAWELVSFNPLVIRPKTNLSQALDFPFHPYCNDSILAAHKFNLHSDKNYIDIPSIII